MNYALKALAVIAVTLLACPDASSATPEMPAAAAAEPTEPVDHFSPSLGYAAITYSQTGRAAYSGTDVFAEFAWNHVFANRSWDVDANAYFNALPISTNLTGINGRFLGVNARVGYAIPKLPDPWFARIALGVYYSSFYVTGNAFGYRNLIYPQIYPVVGYRSASLGTIAGYLKYVPTNAGFVPNLTERELAGGLSFRRPAPGHPNQDMIISVDYSNLIYLPLPSITVQTSAFALSVGVSF